VAKPAEILDIAFQRAASNLEDPIVADRDIGLRVELICRSIGNRAGVRLLMACLLAKIDSPAVDVRKPYTQIRSPDSFSGRTYDEQYITEFVNRHELPCNPTSAFLTPALRNRNTVLTPDLELEGRPREVYQATLQLLTDVHENRVSAEHLLAETLRYLLIVRNERQQRMASLLAGLRATRGNVSLSAEAIVTLIEQHLASPRASRLPVLVVAAAYKTAQNHLEERVLPLESHTAADSQTRALGDLQITLANEDKVVTSYEMKMKRVTVNDIDQAVHKIVNAPHRIDHYIFITTDLITQDVKDYALTIYEDTGGTELVVLDCIGFLRHFLHLFHRLRMQFLDAYQDLVLTEPNSAVSQPLKEAFLTLRQAAESVE
jgi:DNA adenine methylase